MAVVVTDRRTTITSAESVTGWTGANFGVTTTSAEGTNAVAESLAIATGQVYFTGTARNLGTNPGTLVYVWAFNNALQNSWSASPPPNALMLGDGTDRIAFDMAGQDRRVFNHLEGPAGLDVNGWQCLVLDTAEASNMNTAGNTYVVAGSFAGLDFANITDFGCSFDTQSKALGGGYNVAVDIIRIGNDGIRVTGGTTGDRGNFLQIATEDRSRATAKAHGLLRELSTGLYSAQGPITFGGSTQTSWFDVDGIVLVYEARNIANDKYYLNVEGGTGVTHFLMSNSTIKSAGPFVTCDFTVGGVANIDTLDLNAVVFSALGNAITFGNNSAHVVTGCTFDACGVVDPGTTTFTGNTISNTTNADGGLLIDADGTANIIDLSMISDGTGHGVQFTSAGTYALDNWTFSGYGADDTTDAAVYNNSGGAITLNITGGGDSPTVRNGAGASTTVQNVVNFSLTGLQDNTEVRIYRVSDDVELYGAENVTGGTTTYQYNYASDTPVYIHIHHIQYVPIRLELTLGGSDASVPVQQRFDRTYSNP